MTNELDGVLVVQVMVADDAVVPSADTALITGPGMPPAGRAQHFHGPMTFEISGDSATAETYSITYQLDERDRCEVYCLGFNRWEFRREGGRWRIAARHRRELGTNTEAEVVRPIDRA